MTAEVCSAAGVRLPQQQLASTAQLFLINFARHTTCTARMTDGRGGAFASRTAIKFDSKIVFFHTQYALLALLANSKAGDVQPVDLSGGLFCHLSFFLRMVTEVSSRLELIPLVASFWQDKLCHK